MNLEQLLLDYTRDILLLVDPQTLEIRAASPPTLKLLGYSREALIGKPITDVECALSDVFFWEEVRHGGLTEVEGAEGAYLCAGGETIEVLKSVFRIAGEPGWLVVRAEVEQGRSEQPEDALANATSRLRATLEATADGILLVDRNGTIVNMNQHFSQMWRLPDALLMAHDDAAIFNYLSGMLDDSGGRQVRASEILPDSETETFDTLRLIDGRLFERKYRPARHGD
ncbi:MAG TPA: PAS domain-containing protein, partial [Rhodocyclaceae bacterium]|nr:PAS domain-containing protein [Rhodocyclaceae bacterium]